MVVHFKVAQGSRPVYEITPDNVETLLGRRRPWFQEGQQRGDDRHFALCPYCETPIQLKGLYKRKANSPRPHGSHTGKPIEGFAFNEVDLEFCPYRIRRKAHRPSSRRSAGPAAKILIQTAVAEFDRIVLILRDDFGFRFSDAFAGRMLDKWFDTEGFLYTGAHLRNLPWMIAYFGPAQNLFGQRVGSNLSLAEQIRLRVPQATITDAGRLEKGRSFFRLDLQCLHHRMEIGTDAAPIKETMLLRVQDFTGTNEPSKAPLIYSKEITFDPDRFEALLHTPADRARRDTSLLAVAREVASLRGYSDV